MKNLLVLLIVTLLPLSLLAQETEISSDPDNTTVSGGDLNTNMSEGVLNTNIYTGSAISGGDLNTGVTLATPFTPIFSNFQTGMSFGSFGSGSYMQTYVRPSFTVPINKQLSVSTGVTYGHTQFNNLPVVNNRGEYQRYSGGMNTLTVHAAGSYNVSDKLRISGAAYKTVNPALNSRLNPQAINAEAQGVSVGVGYQLNDNSYIGAQISVQQSNSTIYTSPYSTPSMNSLGEPTLNSGFLSGSGY